MKRKMVWFGIPWLAGLFLATACQTSVTVSLLLAAFLLLGAFRLYRRITTGQLLCVGLSAAAAVGAVLLYTTAVYQPLLRSAGTITTFSGRVFAAKVYDNDRASYQVKGTFADGRRAKILVYTDDVGARYGGHAGRCRRILRTGEQLLLERGELLPSQGDFPTGEQ